YLDITNVNGRVIPSLSYKNDEGKWILWVPMNEKLTMLYACPAESEYISNKPDNENDVLLNFYNFFLKHISYPDINPKIRSIRDDFHNICTVIAKIDTYYNLKVDKNIEVHRFVSTELEYLFVVCRSLFDLLQEIISGVWSKVTIFDKQIHKKTLPKSFREMIIKNNKLLSQEEIQSRYNIPESMAKYYFEIAPFFLVLREYRDKVVHSGKTVDIVFELENGFAVDKSSEPFASFNVWKESDFYNVNLASLRPVIHHIITITLKSCDDFIDVISSIIKFPPSLIPNHNIYTRGYHTTAYINLINTIEAQRWWNKQC
ncbi:MAG: hypothetical protein WD512_02370, partial [Candidatus Paceibacterota bacterium]